MCLVLAGCGSEPRTEPAPAGTAGGAGTQSEGGLHADDGAGNATSSSDGSALEGKLSSSGDAGRDTENQATAGEASASGGAPTGSTSGGLASGAGSAGSPSDDVTTGGAAGVGADGEVPGLSSFTRFTARRYEGYPTATHDCRDNFVSEWSFERPTGIFTWNFCQLATATVVQGSRALSGPEVQAVMNALSGLKLITPTDVCFSDSVFIDVDLQVGDVTTTYQTDNGCAPAPAGPVIAWPSNFIAAGEWLAVATIPSMPRKLTVFTGDSPPATGHDCTDPPYPIDYEVDLSTGTVNWTLCTNDPVTGERIEPNPSDMAVLDASTLEAVRTMYAGLTLGVSGPCDTLPVLEVHSDGSVRPPHIEIDGEQVLIDEAASCSTRGSTDGAWTIGVSALTHFVVEAIAP